MKAILMGALAGMLAFPAQSQAGRPVVTYAVHHPDAVEQGDAFTVDVKFSIEPSWYIYASTENNAAQGMIETQVVLTPPEGIKRAGKIKLPEPDYKNGREVYRGSATVSHALRATTSLKRGIYKINGRVTWQACNDDLCLPPVTEEIVVAIVVK